MAEKRKYPRIPLRRNVLVELSDGSSIVASITDLSVSGMGISYGAPAEVGRTLILHFNLPVKHDLHRFKLRGIVRHSHLRNDQYYIGFEFADVDEQASELLSGFIDEVNRRRVLNAS